MPPHHITPGGRRTVQGHGLGVLWHPAHALVIPIPLPTSNGEPPFATIILHPPPLFPITFPFKKNLDGAPRIATLHPGPPLFYLLKELTALVTREVPPIPHGDDRCEFFEQIEKGWYTPPTSRLTDRQTNRQTDRQTDSLTA